MVIGEAGAARGGLVSSRYSKILRPSRSSHGVVKEGCQNHTVWFMSAVRTTFLTAASWAAPSVVSNPGGGPGRKSLVEFRAHGFHCPAPGATALVPLHFPGVGG